MQYNQNQAPIPQFNNNPPNNIQPVPDNVGFNQHCSDDQYIYPILSSGEIVYATDAQIQNLFDNGVPQVFGSPLLCSRNGQWYCIEDGHEKIAKHVH
jgi:hypothetical protein